MLTSFLHCQVLSADFSLVGVEAVIWDCSAQNFVTTEIVQMARVLDSLVPFVSPVQPQGPWTARVD